MIHLEEIVEFLDRFFALHRFPLEERGGVYLPSSRPVKRLGLALEAWTHLPEWAKAKNLDALFLHRPWKLEAGKLTPDLGVIFYHLAFDEQLTISFNPRLAQVLGMSCLEVLGEKDGRAIGMIGEIPTSLFAGLCRCVNQIFGGNEQVHAENCIEVTRIAVVGAMTDALVREAAHRGANVYITGQLRQPAVQAMQETNMAVIAVGHRRSEVWGLRSLAGVLSERWSQLELVIYNTD